ncbi:MAG: pentapeptide repeat-containing protein [Marmoricola sp.]
MPERPRLPSLLLDQLEDGTENDLAIGRQHDCVSFAGIDMAGERLLDRELIECLIAEGRFDDADLRGSRVRETRFERCEATAIGLTRAELREVEFAGCRFGDMQMYDTVARMLHMDGCRLGYLNLRGAELVDVTFTNCTISDLDLNGAQIDRLALPGCRVGTLTVSGATTRDLDLRHAEFEEIIGIEALRGATISPQQLHALGPLLAEHLGIAVG